MKYLKEDLLFDYTWYDNGGINFNGAPSRRYFDPANGQQLLFIINCFYEAAGLQSRAAGARLEHLINNQMPLCKMSEITVFKWLQGVYADHAANDPASR